MTGEKREGNIEEEGTGVDGGLSWGNNNTLFGQKIRHLIPNLKFQCQHCTLAGQWIFVFTRRRHRFWGPPTLPRNRYGGSFPWVKWLGLEAGHSPHPRPEPTLRMGAVLRLAACLHDSLPLGFPITVLYPFLISPICVPLRVYALRLVLIVLLIQSCVA